MTEQAPRVSDYMTPLPITVEVGMTLADAMDRMYNDNIRHLPVVDNGGKLVGLLSTRDVAAFGALRGGDVSSTKVEDAMARVPFTCADHSPLVSVIERMEHDRLGSAIVTHGDAPIGIFTTTDALRVLRGMLLGKEVEPLVHAEVESGEGGTEHPQHIPHHHISGGARGRDGMISWFLMRL